MKENINDNKLSLALERARHREELRGIGTQSERLVHLTLKYYLEPNEEAHEVKVGRYTADIFRKETGEILEIQTRSFERLKKKLDAFLPKYPVTVVYPCVRMKYLCWVDPDTGEVTKRRRSPKIGTPKDILPELYRLQNALFSSTKEEDAPSAGAEKGEEASPSGSEEGKIAFREGLTIMIVMMDVEEYRLLDGWSKDKKHGSHRMERLPLFFGDPVFLRTTEDISALLPETLPETFTRKDLMKALKMQGRKGSGAITVLEKAGAIKRVGAEGRTLLFKKAPASFPEEAGA